MPAQPDVAVVFPQANQCGGVERVAWDITHHFAKEGRSVVFVGQQIAVGADPSIGFAAVNATSPLAFRRAAAKILRELAPRNTISLGANCPPGDVYLVGSVHRAWLRSAKTVHVGGRDVPAAVRYLLPRHQVLLGLEQFYFRSRRPRAMLCVSQREADDLVALYGVHRALLHVVPNGYDPVVFSPQPASVRAATRVRMSVPDDAIVLLLMANELHRKGLGQLITAVAQVDDLRLHIAVVGRTDLAPFAGQVKRLGLTDRVGWYGPTMDAAAWYSGSDLLVLPTQYEPFGLVIVEALATGLPVITTRLAGASNAVQPGVNGLLQQDPYDTSELAGLLRQACDGTVRARWARAASGSVKRFQLAYALSEVARHLR